VLVRGALEQRRCGNAAPYRHSDVILRSRPILSRASAPASAFSAWPNASAIGSLFLMFPMQPSTR
jgi:hypothetical protein